MILVLQHRNFCVSLLIIHINHFKMKKIIVFVFTSLVITACNDSTPTASDAKDSAASGRNTAGNQNIDFVYTTDKRSDWVPGDPQHAAMVMKSLKAFETGNIDDGKQYFADTVIFRGDGILYKGTRDSILSAFKKDRAALKEFVITIHDWQSVKSASRGEEFVRMWRSEKYTDANGKKDSVEVTEDIKIVNGKIASIDKKVRHDPKEKY